LEKITPSELGGFPNAHNIHHVGNPPKEREEKNKSWNKEFEIQFSLKF
jgi:hypothetical protein